MWAACQLLGTFLPARKKAVQPVTLPTAVKEYYSKGWAGKENLLDLSELETISALPDFLVKNCHFSFSVCASAGSIIFS